jgi:hypothetical protein
VAAYEPRMEQLEGIGQGVCCFFQGRISRVTVSYFILVNDILNLLKSKSGAGCFGQARIN